PLQVEPVAWISGMKDLLCGFFVVVALWQYCLAIARGARLHYLISTICFILGMLSKPTAAMTPILAVAIDRWMLQRDWNRVRRSIWPWLGLAIPCVIWTRIFQFAGGVMRTPLWTRPLIATDALAFYLWKLVLPLELAMDYGRFPARAMREHWIYWTWLLPAI